MTDVIQIENLHKTYRIGFFRKRVHAVRGVSFAVKRGEIVGLVGPNGSGKTSTLKVLVGLCVATQGSTKIAGRPSSEAQSRQILGFLPENPYVYPYLTPREFVDLCARLSGVSAAKRQIQVPKVLERTGIAYAADRPVHRLSKGMLQRTGLAGALVADPEVLVLDEPMSGLDPLGRREVRDLIFEERREGRTVLFSSHVLSDVEALCDRVVILRQGKVVVEGVVADLVRRTATLVELTVRLDQANPQTEAEILGEAKILRRLEGVLALEVEGEAALQGVVRRVLDSGGKLISAVPRKDSLEDLFLRNALFESAEAPNEQFTDPPLGGT